MVMVERLSPPEVPSYCDASHCHEGRNNATCKSSLRAPSMTSTLHNNVASREAHTLPVYARHLPYLGGRRREKINTLAACEVREC